MRTPGTISINPSPDHPRTEYSPVKSLIRFLYVTSRRDVLERLTSRRLSLYGHHSGQKKDIEDYVRSIVYSNSEPIMRRWRKEDKELVIDTLSERADGM